MVALRVFGPGARLPVQKAAKLARARGVGVQLLHIVAVPHSSSMVTGAMVRKVVSDAIRQARAALKVLAGDPALKGVPTSVVVVRDYPAADGITRQVLKHRPQLLLVQSHRRGALGRFWMTNTDWELIRQCPCPLWLCKSPRLRRSSTVLAAVDPFHAHDKPAQLDDVILDSALEVAGGGPAKVLVCHAYRVPQPIILDGAMSGPRLTAAQRKAYRESIRRQVRSLANRFAIPAANVLVANAEPQSALPRIAGARSVGTVVMGAVSRGSLKRLFIGNTAERLIDALSSDVLIVKPREFQSNVPRQLRE